MKITLTKNEVVKVFVYLKTFANLSLVKSHRTQGLRLYNKIKKQYEEQNGKTTN